MTMASKLIFIWLVSLSITTNNVHGDYTGTIVKCIDNSQMFTFDFECTGENLTTFVQDASIRRAHITNCSQKPLFNESQRCDRDTTQTNKLTDDVRTKCNYKNRCKYSFENNCQWNDVHPTYTQTYAYVQYACINVSSMKKINLDSYWDVGKQFIIMSDNYPQRMPVQELNCTVEPKTSKNIVLVLQILDFSHNGDYRQVPNHNSNSTVCKSYFCVFLGDVSFDEAERGGPSWTLPATDEQNITGSTTLTFRINKNKSNPSFNQTKFFMQLRASSGGVSYEDIEVKCGRIPITTTTTKTTTTTVTTTTTTTTTTTPDPTSDAPTMVDNSTAVNASVKDITEGGQDLIPMIGGIIGGLLFIFILMMAAVCVARRKRSQREDQSQEPAKPEYNVEDDVGVYYSTLGETRTTVVPTATTEDDDDELTYEMISKDDKPSPPAQGAKNPELADLTSINRIYANEGSTVQAPVTTDAIYQNSAAISSAAVAPPAPPSQSSTLDNHARKGSNSSNTGDLTRDLKLMLKQRGMLADDQLRF